jgi:hypothetical protein
VSLTDLPPPAPVGPVPMASAEPPPDPQAVAREAARLQAALEGLVGRLEREAEDRVAKRQLVERRWLDDLRQLHGEYEPKLRAELEAAKRSTLFVNETRPKTNACEARLVDMLFPTDGRNWGVQPTPVPQLAQDAQRAADDAAKLIAQANAAVAESNPEHERLAAQANDAQATATRLRLDMEEARKRAEAMESEIADQLSECRYSIQARDVIRDACRIGVGVFKGPVANTDRARLSWRKMEGPGASSYELAWAGDPRPAYYRVDPWGFFPDPNARTIEESSDFFERHLMTKKDLRALARQPGFDADAIRRLLILAPAGTAPTYITELRSISGVTAAADARYHVWEYRGPIGMEEMRDLCACLGKDDMVVEGESDPLAEIQVVLWFCQGEILKFGIATLDSGEAIYSVYNLEKDDSSVWGFGIPYLMRDAQRAVNGAWRMMMDNAGLSVGPQLEIDRSVIEPADNDWTLTARKIWLRGANAQGKPGIIAHDIASHQAELAGIIEIAKQLIDDETAMSEIAQGEQGSHTTQTAQGMSILMNSVNVVFRRMVKNFDDDVTIPNIRRLYDWNMQFSDRQDIKGDFNVDARGSSVLLVRETATQNLMALTNFVGHPVLGAMLKAPPLLRKLVQGMMISADEVVKTDEELEQDARNQQAQRQDGQPDPRAEIEMKKIEVAMRKAELDADTKLQVARINRETELAKLAAQQDITVEAVRAKLQMQADDQSHKERIFAAEVGFKDRQSARERAAAANGAPGGPANPPPVTAPVGTRFAP